MEFKKDHFEDVLIGTKYYSIECTVQYLVHQCRGDYWTPGDYQVEIYDIVIDFLQYYDDDLDEWVDCEDLSIVTEVKQYIEENFKED